MVDFVCDLQHREMSLSMDRSPDAKEKFGSGTLVRLVATFGRPAVLFGPFSWVQEEAAACLGA